MREGFMRDNGSYPVDVLLLIGLEKKGHRINLKSNHFLALKKCLTWTTRWQFKNHLSSSYWCARFVTGAPEEKDITHALKGGPFFSLQRDTKEKETRPLKHKVYDGDPVMWLYLHMLVSYPWASFLSMRVIFYYCFRARRNKWEAILTADNFFFLFSVGQMARWFDTTPPLSRREEICVIG